MRSRYSRRIYSMKLGNNRSSDYIDDEDIKFLENLISRHKSYLENFKRKMNLDSSLLLPKLGDIYNKIFETFSITKTEGNKELYNSLDLKYQGEEYHHRNLKEQIINYLNNKKHQIFTNHRVDFLINIVLNYSEQENLRDNCKEIVYKSNKIDVSDDVDFESIEYNEYDDEEVDARTINNMILTNLAKMDTLLLPYISMLHPKPKMEYEEANRFILETIRQDKDEKSLTKRINEKLEFTVENKSNRKKSSIFNLNNNVKLPEIQNIELIMTKSSPKNPTIEQLDNFDEEQSDDSNNFSLHHHSTLMDNINDENNRRNNSLPPPAPPVPISSSSSSRQFPNFVSPIESSSSPNHSVYSPREIMNSPEIIEISDEEENADVDEINNKEDNRKRKTHREPSQLSYSDIDQMIDFLIHRCNVNHDLHPSLLRDYQMNVELNGFLLFVNFSIRFSLKYPLNHNDRQIFDCIFISSVTVGLVSCLVNIDRSGIKIDKLTNTGFYIVNSRLRSVQISIKHVEKNNDDDLFSIIIDPDISRLVNLTLFYIKGYHDTGILVERTVAGPD